MKGILEKKGIWISGIQESIFLVSTKVTKGQNNFTTVQISLKKCGEMYLCPYNKAIKPTNRAFM